MAAVNPPVLMRRLIYQDLARRLASRFLLPSPNTKLDMRRSCDGPAPKAASCLCLLAVFASPPPARLQSRVYSRRRGRHQF